MRWLLGLVLAAGMVWGGYWFVGANALDSQVNAWFDRAAASGQDIGRTAVTVAGFPNRFDVTVTDPFARDPISGWGWKAPFVQVFSMTWKPWHLIAALPASEQITLPSGQVLTVKGDHLRGSLLMVPNLDLTLNQAVFEGSALQVTADTGWTLGAERLVLAAGADPSWKNGLRLGLQATRIAPDLAAVAQVPDLGAVIADLHLDATVQLTAPVDRHFGQADAHVTALHVTEAHAVWGPLILSVKGEVLRDANGLASGTLQVSLDHWQRLPDALTALKILPASAKPLFTRALTLLAAGAANPDQLLLPLMMKNGRMSLGALPLGAAPRLP